MPKPLPKLAADSGRPEARLLLRSGQVREDSDGAEAIATALAGDLDWDYLLPAASRHGMTPLLYQYLKTARAGIVPETVLDQLRDSFHTITRHNLFLAGQLFDLLELFEANAIPAIPFKGPVLAVFAYGDLSLRQFVDLDIIVRRKDVLRSKELLVSRGYRPALQLSRVEEKVFVLSDFENYPLKDTTGSFEVELHWGVTRRLSIALDADRLHDCLIPVSVSGREIRTLRTEDLLLTLCVHGAVHFWERLAWVCDVAKLVAAHRSLEWERVLNQATALGCRRMLFLGLLLAGELLRAPVPKEILLRAHGDREAESLAEQVCREMFRDSRDPPSALERFRLEVRMRERLRDRVRHCLAIALTPRVQDAEFLPLPGPLSPLYYLVRPVRLLLQYGFGAARRERVRARQREIERKESEIQNPKSEIQNPESEVGNPESEIGK